MGCDLDTALRQLEVVEANLVKLERLWKDIQKLIPDGVAFLGMGPEGIAHEEKCRAFRRIMESMPAIEGWSLDVELPNLDEIAQWRLNAQEIDEIEAIVRAEQSIQRPGEDLREYRARFDMARRELIRRRVKELIQDADTGLARVGADTHGSERGVAVESPGLDAVRAAVAQIDTLLGSSVPRPPRWDDLRRHLHFGLVGDLCDIVEHDWPVVKPHLERSLYGEDEPLPVEITDLSELINTHPTGPVTTRLQWEMLSDEDFERLVFNLINATVGYENAAWLTHTRAPDRGRDLSVTRVREDALSGTQRDRVIIQCKHWLATSVCPADVSLARDQMALWEPPPVDVLVICTSGRFTTDAVQLIEKHNTDRRRPAIEMWPESTLEQLLAQRPHLVAEFKLKSQRGGHD